MIFFGACCWCASFKFVNRLSIGRILIRVICWSVCGGWGHTERSSWEAYGMPGCGSCFPKTKPMGKESEGVRLWALRSIDVMLGWTCEWGLTDRKFHSSLAPFVIVLAFATDTTGTVAFEQSEPATSTDIGKESKSAGWIKEEKPGIKE